MVRAFKVHVLEAPFFLLFERTFMVCLGFTWIAEKVSDDVSKQLAALADEQPLR